MTRALAALLCGWSLPCSGADARLAFDVYLDDRRVGEHEVRVTQGHDVKYVQVEARIDVTLLSLPLYRYRHQAQELWRDDCIERLVARTEDDGERLHVTANRDGAGLTVETPAGGKRLDGCVRTFAYWAPELLRSGRLLNTQTGEYERTELTRVGGTPMASDGRRLGTVHYRLRVAGKPDIALWYDADDRWSALRTTVSGDRELRYLRKEVEK